MKIFTDKTQIIDALKSIPPCSIGVESGDSMSNRLIAGYWPLWKRVLAGKSVGWWELLWHGISHPFKKVDPCLKSHAFVYWGGGEHTVIETIPSSVSWYLFTLPHGKVATTDLKDKIKPKDYFSLYANSLLTVPSMQIAKAYNFGTIGRLYDLSAFVGFADTNLNRDYTIDDVDICIENSIDTMRKAGLRLLDKKKSGKIHPEEAHEYLESSSGFGDGWYKILDWDGNKAKFFTL